MAFTRNQMVELALRYKGATTGSAKHKDLVNTFNKVRPHGEVGNYRCPWCAITVTAWFLKGGWTQSNMAMSYNCGTLISDAKKLGIWVENDAYIPKIGDVIIYYWGDSGKGDATSGASHVGMVISVGNKEFTVLEGNKGSGVCDTRSMVVNARYIRGFITPRYSGDESLKTTYKPSTPFTGSLPSKNVGYGTNGSDTKKVQKFLNWAINAKLTVDGECGAKTVLAIQIFEATYNVPNADGIFGAGCRNAANELITKFATTKTATTTKETTTETKVVTSTGLTVDGVGGKATVKAMQKFFGSTVDGVISGQKKSLSKYYPAVQSVTFDGDGSACVAKMQKWLGINADGIWGKGTSVALQKKLGVEADGVFGKNSMKALQKYLNAQTSSTETKKTSTSTSATTTPTTTTKKSVYNVIDVSSWQGKIDWKKVKAAGIDGAIIRYADGTTLDSCFDQNMKGAIAAGLHVGCYIYSRAKTKAKARTEAERLYKAVKQYKYDMPMYIDLEASAIAKYANTVAAAFITKMDSLGGWAGIYANLNWYNNYLVKTLSKYSARPLWIAQYNNKITHKTPSLFGIWQYTSSGSVNGINGRVDRDKCYVAYWDKK